MTPPEFGEPLVDESSLRSSVEQQSRGLQRWLTAITALTALALALGGWQVLTHWPAVTDAHPMLTMLRVGIAALLSLTLLLSLLVGLWLLRGIGRYASQHQGHDLHTSAGWLALMLGIFPWLMWFLLVLFGIEQASEGAFDALVNHFSLQTLQQTLKNQMPLFLSLLSAVVVSQSLRASRRFVVALADNVAHSRYLIHPAARQMSGLLLLSSLLLLPLLKLAFLPKQGLLDFGIPADYVATRFRQHVHSPPLWALITTSTLILLLSLTFWKLHRLMLDLASLLDLGTAAPTEVPLGRRSVRR